MLGVELGWYTHDAIIEGSDVSQLLLLRLPVDKGLPETVWAKVCSCRKHCVFISTNDGGKGILSHLLSHQHDLPITGKIFK